MLRYELTDRMLETEIARMFSYRVVTLQNRGLIPNYEASMMKLYNTELNQRIARTGMRIAGPVRTARPRVGVRAEQGTQHLHVPALGRLHDRGRHERSAAEHRGPARPRAAERLTLKVRG